MTAQQAQIVIRRLIRAAGEPGSPIKAGMARQELSNAASQVFKYMTGRFPTQAEIDQMLPKEGDNA